MSMLKIDYSSSNTYYECPLKYFLQHKEGWTSEFGSSALRAGSVFHAGMEGYYSYIKENGWSRDGGAVSRMLEYAAKDWERETGEKKFYDDHRTLPNIIEVLTSYIDHFYEDHGFVEILHTERAFQLQINPREEDLNHFPTLQPFYFTGKIDQEIKLNGMNWTNEFKTTGWRLDQVVSELNRSPQILGYAYAKNKVYQEPPEGCMATVAFFSARKVKSGDYGKLSIDFRRIPQIFNNEDLEKWREHFISLASQVQEAEKRNHFPPRLQSCYKYGRCGFLNICEQSCQVARASFRGYVQQEPWDVTKEVSPSQLMIAEDS